MKKFFMLMAVAVAALMTACSQKEAQPVETENENAEQHDAATSATPKANATMSAAAFVLSASAM